jgi:hypothetical protein
MNPSMMDQLRLNNKNTYFENTKKDKGLKVRVFQKGKS